MTSQHVFADNIRENSLSTGTGNFITTGGAVAIPTPTAGRALAEVFAVGDSFDYAIHHQDTNEWEVGRGTYTGTNTFTRDKVYASSNSGNLVSFSSGQKTVLSGPVASFKNYAFDLYNIVNYDAVNGSDNTAEIAAARAAAGPNRPVMAPFGSSVWGIKQSTLADFTNDQLGEGSALSFSQGSTASPSTSSNPLLYLEKYSVGNGDNNDHGLLDLRFRKQGGTGGIYSYGAYIAAENTGGDGGRVAALATLMKTTNTDTVNDVALVVYAEKAVETPSGLVTALEVDILDSSGEDNGWQTSFTTNCTRGIALTNATGRATTGMHIATATAGNGFYTGILFDVGSILPNSYDGNAEAIRIKGGSTSADRYTGIWFQSGYLEQALNLTGPTYASGVAVLMPKDNYISFGSSSATAERIKWNNSVDALDIEGGGLAIAGTQVLTSRITGWGTVSGTATRTGFTTSSVDVATLAEHVKALIDDLKTHGVIGT